MLLWVAEDRLAHRTRSAIAAASRVYVSAATIWEIEIKRKAGRLRGIPDDLVLRVDHAGFERLPITFEHASETGRLPLIHGDPFDRLLIAQARLERMTLATADEHILRYEVPVLMVARV